MHYNTIKDAALLTAITVMTGFCQPSNALQALACYLVIFMVLTVLLEIAQDWMERRKRNDK